MAGQSREPLSPWAQRYGVSQENESTLEEGVMQHSGYHAGHPRLDPKFFAEPISESERQKCGKFDHQNDIHRLFHIEQKQSETHRGFKLWQYGPLMQYVRFSDRGLLPGGHWRPGSKPYRQASHDKLAEIDRLIHDDMITVDEDNWLIFFRRDRWYDTYGQKQGGKRWSIDQPKLWEKMRISVELADRILKALINDRNPDLHTMLFGTLIKWSDTSAMQPFPEPFPDAKVILSYGLYKQFCDINGLDCPLDHIAQLSSEDWKIMLETLLRNQTWGFTDDPSDNGAHWPDYGNVITLGTNMIQTLMGDDITLAERCQLQLQLTRTILHELMHALGQNRHDQVFPTERPRTPGRGGIDPEPFIDFDGISELGYAIEQRIFGGVITNLHPNGRYPLGAHHHSWPFLSQPPGHTGMGYRIQNHPIFSLVQDVVISAHSALYSSKLLSKSFWEDANIPRKSDNFFHRSRLIAGTSEFDPKTPFSWQDIYIDGGKFSRGELEPGEHEIVESWRYWRYTWNGLRLPWYREAKQIWLGSPWSKIDILESISEFGREFRKGNEIRCAQISDELTRSITWPTERDTYIAALLPPSFDWIVHCIGLLMMAAIPIRKARLAENVIQLPITLQLHPSARAPLLPHIDILPDFFDNVKSCRASELFDPIDTGSQPIAIFDHLDIISVLRNAIRVVVESNVLVSKPWFSEILRVCGILEGHRDKLITSDPTYHQNLWAPDWDFKIPSYEPDELGVWDAARKDWVGY